MNTSPTKTQAKSTVRGYSSVSDLLRKETGNDKVCGMVSALNAGTVVVRQLVSLRVGAGLTQADLA